MRSLPLAPLFAFALAGLAPLGGCERAAAPQYFPLREDLEWQYRIEKTVLSERVTQKSIVRSLEAVTTEDGKMYPRVLANGKRYRFFVTDQGLYRLAADNARQNLILGFPLQKGTTWIAPTRLFLFTLPTTGAEEMLRLSRDLQLDYEISSVEETVESEAGRFHNCLRVDAVGLLRFPRRVTLGVRAVKVRDTEWYCPGVGLVKKIRHESAAPLGYPAEYRQELIRFARL